MLPRNKFVPLNIPFLQSIATESNRIPTLYYSASFLVRYFFCLRLKLLHYLMCKHSTASDNCLDFGGGGGVFLPTLSNTFEKVVCVDLEDKEAQQAVTHFSLQNVTLVKGDVSSVVLLDAPFKCIVAADVLEHFSDVSVASQAIDKWLDHDGYLYTSLPTENFIYTLLRKVFNVEKPWDHYHTAQEVENHLEENGFVKVSRLYVPLCVRVFPLFRITAWKRKQA